MIGIMLEMNRLIVWIGLSYTIFLSSCARTATPLPAPVANTRTSNLEPNPERVSVPPAEYRTIDRLPGIDMFRRHPGGEIELTISLEMQRDGWELAARDTHNVSMRIGPKERVYLWSVGVLGAGLRWLEYRGDRGEFALFSEGHWFYDIVPEYEELMQVRPYAP